MLSNRLENERTKRNLTQEEVAQKIGVARSTYANYESGKREPDLATIKKIADLYGISVGYLVDGRSADVPPEQAEFLQWVEDNLEETFFYDFHKSPEEQKEEMMETLRLLWEQEKRRAERRQSKDKT